MRILEPLLPTWRKREQLRSFRLYLLVVFVAGLYAAFLTRTYYWDGVLFSLNIEGVYQGRVPTSVLFHPNHLLYSGLGYLLYSAALHLGFHLRAITVLQVSNVVASVATAFVILQVSKRITSSPSLGLFSFLLFAFGATWWKFSTDADSYIISVFFLTVAVGFALDEPPRLARVAACHVFAMLFHELAIFIYFAVITAIALDPRRSRAKKFLACIAYCLATGACIAVAYLLCYFYAGRGTYPSLLDWVTSYASNSGFTHSFAQLAGSYLSSYIKLFVGGKLPFIHDYFSIAVGTSLAICFGALAAAFVLFRRIRPREEERPSVRTLLILWAWFLPCALFLASWDPGSAFHKLFVWPPIVLLISCYIASHNRSRLYAPAFSALAIAIGAWNFAAFIYPHSHASSDPVLELAQTVNRELPRNATVYYKTLNPDDWYLEYFAPGRTWVALPSESSLLPVLVHSLPKRPVCLETTALAALEKDYALSTFVALDPILSWDLVTKGHNIRLKCLKTAP